MAVNDIWMLSVSGLVQAQRHIHTLHFRETGTDLVGANLLTAYNAAPRAAYRALFGNQHTPDMTVRAQKVCGSVPLPSPDEVTFTGAEAQGARNNLTEEFLPSFVACLVVEKGTIAGRRYSGRFFLGGLHETDCANNTLTAPYLALVQQYIDALKTAFVTPPLAAWKLFAFSRLLADGDPLHTKRDPNNPGERIADPVAVHQCQDAGSPVRDLVVSNRPTTMRSRKLGHGS